MVKNLPAMQKSGFNPWVKRIPWRRALKYHPRESHGQRSLVGYSPWGLKESDMIEQLTLALPSQDLSLRVPACPLEFHILPLLP